MATLTKGKTFTTNEVVTPTKLNDLVDKATIRDIVNADISASAAIEQSKIGTISTAGKVSGTAITSGNISTSGSITTSGSISTSSNLSVSGNSTLTGNVTISTGNLSVGSGYISGKINPNWISKTDADTGDTVSDGDLISADTRSAAFTLKLPANPSKFHQVIFADHYKTWDQSGKNLTIDRNGKLIEGLAENLTCNVPGKQFTLRYEEATIGWRIYTTL
jgi:hypothetical protein